MLVIPNKHVLVPVSEEVIVPAKMQTADIPRRANTATFVLLNQTQITLPFMPISAAWVEIYQAEKRMLNSPQALKTGGMQYKKYNVQGNVITFNTPISGEVKVVCDTLVEHYYGATIIDVKNVQYYQCTAAQLANTPAGQYCEPVLPQHGQYCEPIVITQPRYGYARLTTDRQSIAYVSNKLFKGTDSFTYTLMSQNGQYGRPMCAFITVT